MKPIIASCVALGIGTAALAGSLTPPAGPVAPTPGPEPRIAINTTNTPGDADSIYRITAPGSYYLTGNLAGVAAKHGIEIASPNVSIDLMGFELVGVAGSLDGVRLTLSSADNIEVRSGTVRSWDGDGVNLRDSGGKGCRVHQVRVDSCGSEGITVFNHGSVTECTVTESGFKSINVSSFVTVARCHVDASGDDGITAQVACTISECTVSNSGLVGIRASSNSTVTKCVVYNSANTGISGGSGGIVSECVSTSNATIGISAGGTLVIDCSVQGNDAQGISASSDSVITGNKCDGNLVGIRVTGSDNRIEGNKCTDNDTGVEITGTGNFISRNTCSGNTVNNWDIAAGNMILVINAAAAGAFTGDAGGVTPGSTNPNANYTY